MPSSRWIRAAAILALWTIPPVALTASLYVRQAPPPIPWQRFFTFQILQWWPWALLTPVLGSLQRRWPLVLRTEVEASGSRWTSSAVHLVAAFGIGFLLTAGQLVTELAVAGRQSTVAQVLSVTWLAGRGTILVQMAVYGLVLGAFEAVAIYRRDREREERLTRARLRALQSQLQPHFLFNTLHAISSLMDEDVSAARRMIARLSELLRASLDTEGPIVPLRQELDTARLYLEIEEVRFEDRLRVTWDVEPDVLDADVPHLLLQPLLENAIRHGVNRLVDAGELKVRAQRRGGELEITVDDDGPGPELPDAEAGSQGIGLGNTRARLAALYGDAARLELRARQPRGARAIVRLPYRAAEVRTR